MSVIKDKIILEKLPKHIAIIMDGNGRWAKSHGKPRLFGHKNGVVPVREVTEACAELGVSYLTLYAFSTENWKRPKFEVNALMALLVDTLAKEIDTLHKNNIRLKVIGDIEKLPSRTKNALLKGIEKTANNKRLTLILALNYSGRSELASAAKKIAKDIENKALSSDEINEDLFEKYLYTADYPDPELLIRTSGEHRLSNFLLWQLAYSEIYFTPIMWPDFGKEELYEAIVDFQNRERRFGMTGDQVK